jgi:hypothetical protein
MLVLLTVTSLTVPYILRQMEYYYVSPNQYPP